MKTTLNIPILTDKQSMIDFMIKLYPDQKPYLDHFDFDDLKTSVKQVLIHFNSIHSNDFELNPPINNRYHQINVLFEYQLSDKVITYIRKNPRQVYKNYKLKKSIFGPYSNFIHIMNINSIMKIWKGIYNRKQLDIYESV